ncbi:peptidylprolyl isomerase [Trifolium repens]|nr:peptidylprolyl isomerase [Trifolium repens]
MDNISPKRLRTYIESYDTAMLEKYGEDFSTHPIVDSKSRGRLYLILLRIGTRKVLKKILKEGEGYERPNDGAMVQVFQLLGLAKMSHCRINPLSLPLEVMRMLFGVEHTHETCQIWWNMKANQIYDFGL